MRDDASAVGSFEEARVETFTQDDVDRKVAEALQAQNERATWPGYEEGPHLQDPEIRAAKKEQMRAAGMTLDDPNLTQDMREILEEDD